ncbi:papain-like cysteine peptidase [Grimontia kaedaensis]|uniref:Papain-like cysteine peptidase n=1 Tax=Grimontia kaedaensis TaxID=2872157 RepID=A0ABY4X2E7_9GAMM|nr:DUF1796 family putative cysteine peptidase [Grimontia kaedaensis]USH05439.1 papain-like cysteine peptidase [Grimontia kaedaensis]
MLDKIKKKLSKVFIGGDSHTDFTALRTSEDVYKCIQEADKVKTQLAEFMGDSAKNTKFVSLGENCSSAWYLKQLGLKKASYPFDWVFSSPEIILDCLNDNFEKYLDKGLIVPKRGGTSAGHSYYHDDLFNHRNPLASDNDYSYLQRCCDRLTGLVQSQHSACYLITLINEPGKRLNWANGFNKQFAMPEGERLQSVSSLVEYLRERNENSKFVLVDHYTDSDKPLKCGRMSDDVFFMQFHARGKSTGVLYENELDDFCFKLILTGLYGEAKGS